MQTTIALVDDHKLFREGLKSLLQSQPDFAVVAEAADAQEAYEVVVRTAPDVVVLDMLIPGTSGAAVAREILRRNPMQKVIALSMVKDDQHVADALGAGVLGYASKEQSVDDVVNAIRAVAQRKAYLAPGIPQVALDARSQRNGTGPLAVLTRREREIFDVSVSGLSTAQIAQRLNISRRTVETHRARILRKLNAHSVSDLVRLAARLGLLAP